MNDNSISIKIELDAEDAIKKLEHIKQMLEDIAEKTKEMGIDLGQAKDYTTTQFYADGELVGTETIYYK